MRIEAEKISGNALVSDNPDLGFVVANDSGTPLTPNNLNSKIPFRLDASRRNGILLFRLLGVRGVPLSFATTNPKSGLSETSALPEIFSASMRIVRYEAVRLTPGRWWSLILVILARRCSARRGPAIVLRTSHHKAKPLPLSAPMWRPMRGETF